MALFDWNFDGKIDIEDDAIEFALLMDDDLDLDSDIDCGLNFGFDGGDFDGGLW